MGGNRVGKTFVGGYETALHATGMYPDWWTGRKFAGPVNIWCAGKTNETTRDIVQNKLFGDLIHEDGRKRMSGTGMIPLRCIGDLTWKPGLPDLVDIAKIHHVAGGFSKIGMKTYEQGRGAFEGTEQHFIWIDEEPPIEVYEECRMRIMTVSGMMVITFTPLEGMSDVVMKFLNIKPQETREPPPMKVKHMQALYQQMVTPGGRNVEY
jgi:phage terminase large subunit-like protein